MSGQQRIAGQADVERAKLARWIGESGWQTIDPVFPSAAAICPPGKDS